MYILEGAEHILTMAARLGVSIFELICAVVLVWGCGQSLLGLLRRKPHITLTLTRYMNISLLFKLCAEVLRLIYVRTFYELGLVAGIVALHAAISFIIQWEIRREESHDISQDREVKIKEDLFL